MNINITKLQQYAKTVVAVCGFVLIAATACVDGVVTQDELMQIIVAAGVVVGVRQVPNKPL